MPAGAPRPPRPRSSRAAGAPRGAARALGAARVLGPLVALGLLGVLTGLLGAAVHLARVPVLGVLVPQGLVLALLLVLACDVAVAAAALRRRPGAGRSLLAVSAGRAVATGLLLLPRPEGDLVLTGLPASTAWILLSVLVPAFGSPMATALALPRRPRAAPTTAGAR